jgi:hypothetical protein
MRLGFHFCYDGGVVTAIETEMSCDARKTDQPHTKNNYNVRRAPQITDGAINTNGGEIVNEHKKAAYQVMIISGRIDLCDVFDRAVVAWVIVVRSGDTLKFREITPQNGNDGFILVVEKGQNKAGDGKPAIIQTIEEWAVLNISLAAMSAVMRPVNMPMNRVNV